MELLIDPGKHGKWLERTQPTLDYIDAALTTRRTAIDAGAAEGLVTEWLAARFDLTHAFEPVPANFDFLSRREWSGRVICHNLALGDCSGTRGIAGKGHSAHLTDRTDCAVVPVVTLDELDIPDVDLIKIDVEGFETRVIRGALKLIDACRPMIMFERKHLFGTRYNDENPRALLERHGYRKAFKGPLDTVMAYRRVA